MSLDESEFEVKASPITILTTVENTVIELKYDFPKFTTLTQNCNFCKQILKTHTEKQYKIPESIIDLTKYKYANVKSILEYLEKGIYPKLSAETDVKDLYELCNYLGLDDQITMYCNFTDTENRFYSELNEFDRRMVAEEFKLRTMLYTDEKENKDFRSLDKNYEINQIIAELKLPDYQDFLPIPEAKKVTSKTILNPVYAYDPITNTQVLPIEALDAKNKPYLGLIANRNDIAFTDSIGQNMIELLTKDKKISAELIQQKKNNLYFDLLKKFSYKNYVAAGGFIYHNPTVESYNKSVDIDLFITTKDSEQAIEAIKDIYAVVRKSNPSRRDILITVNGNALNFILV